MVHQLAEADREGADGSRHQDVSTRGCLRTTLQRAVMQWSHLVGMVREVGVRACIVERELSTDKQTRLMMAGRERSAESCTGLAIRHERIGKEQAGFSREAIGNLASLAHEAVLHLHAVVDATSVTDDGVLANNTRSDIYRGVILSYQIH